MSKVAAWEAPLTVRERVSVGRTLWWMDRKRWWGETLPHWIATHLPWRVKFWAMIQVASLAVEDDVVDPDKITYSAMHDAWLKRHEKGQ